MHDSIQQTLRQYADPAKAKTYARFFKAGKGEYGEGDQFLGLMVPEVRSVARQFLDTPRANLLPLLRSRFHEERLVALLILVEQYKRAGARERRQIVSFYLRNTHGVNNWDLVDLTADKILGAYLLNKPRNKLYQLVKSKNLWERRIAIIATFAFIRNNDFSETFRLSGLLLKDDHDLIHKAVGWMLREVGKRDQQALEHFLNKHAVKMPRTALRYAIERLSEKKKLFYMKK